MLFSKLYTSIGEEIDIRAELIKWLRKTNDWKIKKCLRVSKTETLLNSYDQVTGHVGSFGVKFQTNLQVVKFDVKIELLTTVSKKMIWRSIKVNRGQKSRKTSK